MNEPNARRIASCIATMIITGCGDKRDPAPIPRPISSASVANVANADAAVQPTPPPWIQLRVGRVRIAKVTTPWDGPKTEAGFSGGCKALIQSVGVASHADTREISDFACNIFGDSQVQTDPTLPDLQLQLRVHDTTYQSYIAFDQTTHTFDYPFVVPLTVVPDAGIVLTVVDADDGGTSQEIGSVRVTKDQLTSAYATKSLLTLSAPGLEVLELDVSVSDGTFKRRIAKLDTKNGGEVVAGFPVIAGEVLRIEARGKWDLGGIFSTQVGPDGNPRDHNYNLPLFHDAGNGAAVALIGRAGAVFPVVVKDKSCARFVAPYSGSIWVGVNDNSPNDNTGVAEFTVMKRGANETQWQSPGSLLDCI